MKTRNPLHGPLHILFTLALAGVFASLALGSVACGAAPGSPGPDGRETTEPLPAADGADSGEPAAEGTDGGDPAALMANQPEPAGAVAPLPPVETQPRAPLQAAEAPVH